MNRMQAPEITSPAATEWFLPLLIHVVCSERIPFVRCRGVTAVHNAFLSLVTLTFGLDI